MEGLLSTAPTPSSLECYTVKSTAVSRWFRLLQLWSFSPNLSEVKGLGNSLTLSPSMEERFMYVKVIRTDGPHKTASKNCQFSVALSDRRSLLAVIYHFNVKSSVVQCSAVPLYYAWGSVKITTLRIVWLQLLHSKFLQLKLYINWSLQFYWNCTLQFPLLCSLGKDPSSNFDATSSIIWGLCILHCTMYNTVSFEKSHVQETLNFLMFSDSCNYTKTDKNY